MASPPIANSYWLEPGRVLCGEYPLDFDGVTDEEGMSAILDQAGVRVFIDLTHEGELKPYRELAMTVADDSDIDISELEFHRHPIADGSIPRSQLEMEHILKRIDTAWQAEKPVYVHCWGGKGRTGMVAGCFLSEKLDCDGADALKALRERWKSCAKSAYADSPETDEQCGFVRKWERIGQLYS